MRKADADCHLTFDFSISRVIRSVWEFDPHRVSGEEAGIS